MSGKGLCRWKEQDVEVKGDGALLTEVHVVLCGRRDVRCTSEPGPLYRGLRMVVFVFCCCKTAPTNLAA